MLQILAITLDNAANNNTLVNELGELLMGFDGALTHVRCFAHIFNLVVKVHCHYYSISYHYISKPFKSVLSQFSHKKKAGENDGEDDEDDDTDPIDNDSCGDADNGNKSDSGDEVDSSVKESDADMVDVVADEVDEDESLPKLSLAKVNLSKFAVTKVRYPIIGTGDC